MNSESKQIQDLQEIKNLMERSSRFLSLSGLSGISAGIVALAGAAGAYVILDWGRIKYDTRLHLLQPVHFENILLPLMILGISVLVLALALGLFFSWRKAKKNNFKMWDHTTKRLLINLLIPLVSGGFFSLLLIYRSDISLLASVTLIFYGLALVNASKYTLDEIRYLGISEIILGMLAGIFINFGLFFWAIGFGVLHIVYGALMYYRYER